MKNKKKLKIIFGICLVIFLSFNLIRSIKANGASIYLSPASESFIVGDTFSVEVKVNTAGTAINSAKGSVYFSPEQLEVVDISKEDSIFVLWPEEPALSKSLDKISFLGGLPHPGFSGVGNLITVQFKAKKEGLVNLNLGEGKVLASDGKGTDILVFIKDAKYSIKEKPFLSGVGLRILPDDVPSVPQVFSSTHPDQEEWYNNSNPRFKWELTSEITEVSFILDSNPDTIPDTEPQARTESKSYDSLSDGIYYFHLRLADKAGWGDTAHYKIKVDSSPPHPFEVNIDNGGDPTNPSPDLYFETSDDISGIDHYKFKIGEGEFSELVLAQVNPFSLVRLAPGQHPIIVRAADQAGNNVETKTTIGIEPIQSPKITLWPEFHISGEEVFYLEGQSLPEVDIIIFLKKDGEEIKRWVTTADTQGGWSFSTKELIKSGAYQLFAQAQDNRGAVSNLSEGREIEVSLSGLCFGPFIVSLKDLALFLLLIIILGIVVASFLFFKVRKAKKILKKETQEAKDVLDEVFDNLKRKVEKQIEMFDSQPGFSKREKEVYEKLKETLNSSKEEIRKEIRDVERRLK